jgi:hypothetical protein
MRDVLEREDRRLQEWLKNVSFQIIKQYESDAMLIREQLRRLSSPATELGGEADRDQLEADLRALRGATPPTRDTACAAAEPAPSLSARAPATTALTHCDRELH